MGQWIHIDTSRGPVRAWLARPDAAPRGAVVVLQEIFGANAHVRDIARRLADAGHTALAPSLFDPIEPGVDLRYDEAGMARGRLLAAELGFDAAIDIVRACSRWLRESGHAVAAVGFCWGGSLAYLANTRLGLPASSWYGARTVPFLGEPLQAPMQFHFGADDPVIPAADIARHRAAHPDAEVFVYPDAGHAFNRDVDPHHYAADAATLAWQRTLDFLARVLA